jgi:hypothetical protein
MAKLPGPTMDEVPGMRPAPGITRVNLEKGDYGAGGVSVPEKLANEGMDTAYPTEGRRRSLNGPNNR